MFDWRNWIYPPEKRRLAYLAQAQNPAMQAYYQKPFAAAKIPFNELQIIALDFETTGLDPRNDSIVSYGLVEIAHAAIQLNTAHYEMIHSVSEMPEAAAVVHKLTDDEINQARKLQQVLPDLLQQLAGKVLLAHYHRVELMFLDAACRNLYGTPFIIPVIDTLHLAQRVLQPRNHALQTERLRLFQLRDDFDLPRYPAHMAFYDALTTAELFLLLEAEINPRRPSTLKELRV